ncbi:MAG: hypothetical protein JWO69_1352 [Thermoleophilia bacterium]|nr:hypothetical protein [Thermoleophilia bacterium]
MDSAAPSTDQTRRGMILRIAVVLAVATALLAAAWLMTGPRPAAADAGFAKAPPPLALPSDTPDDSPLATAAAQLATDDLASAREAFIDIVAADSDDVPAQVGLILSGWRGAGPISVERDLTQLASEYPEDAQVALHLGLVRSLVGSTRAARAAYRDAIEFGREAADPTSLRMASLADDLLHPDSFSGYPPVLVQAAEAAPASRAALARLVAAATRNDRLATQEAATQLADARDGMARVAAAVAIYDKDDPSVSASRLEALADSSTATPQARDRARLHLALVSMWAGDERDRGCGLLQSLVAGAKDEATSRLAAPIRSELCMPDEATAPAP